MLVSPKVNTSMTDFIIKKLLYDLSSHPGLVFIGKPPLTDYQDLVVNINI